MIGDFFITEDTARVLAVIAYGVMFFCMGLGWAMIRLEPRPRSVSENVPAKSSESDHSKAPILLAVMPASFASSKDRNAFGHAHSQFNLVPLDAQSMAREALGGPENLLPGTENVRR